MPPFYPHASGSGGSILLIVSAIDGCIRHVYDVDQRASAVSTSS